MPGANSHAIVLERFETVEKLQLEWTQAESGFESDWYVEGYLLWLDRVYLAGTSSSSIPYRRLVWKGFTEDFYLNAFFLKPLADQLQLDRGVLRMIYAQTVDGKGWPTCEEMVLGYEG